MNNAKNLGSVGEKMGAEHELIIMHNEHDRWEAAEAIPDISAPTTLSTIMCVVIDSERSVLFYMISLPTIEEILEEALHCSIYHVLEVQILLDNKSN